MNKFTEAWKETAEERGKMSAFIDRVIVKTNKTQQIETDISSLGRLLKGMVSEKRLLNTKITGCTVAVTPKGILLQNESNINATRMSQSFFIDLIRSDGIEIADKIDTGGKKQNIHPEMLKFMRDSDSTKTEILRKMHEILQPYKKITHPELELKMDRYMPCKEIIDGNGTDRNIKIDGIKLSVRGNMTVTVPIEDYVQHILHGVYSPDSWMVAEQLYTEIWELLTRAEFHYDKLIENNGKVLRDLKEELAPYIIANNI